MSLFLEPKTVQHDNHMVMTNVYKPEKVKYINIDSQFQDEYNIFTNTPKLTADFNISLPERINEVKSITVTNIELPISFYNISDTLDNNSFQIDNTTYTIPNGQYTISSLLTKINELSGITITVDENLKINIKNNGGTIYFQESNGIQSKYNVKSKLGWLLGFRLLSYTLNNTDGITSESIVNLNGPKYLYLALEEFNKSIQNSFSSPLFSSFINKNIISRITLNNSEFGSILYANQHNGLLLSDIRNYNGKNVLQKLNVQVLNDLGQPMNLNGLDFSFCIKVVYE
tara:strand:+ start:3137 stop:3994 length:858 start_codon:yes stop_codon:yes gene_type:complete